MKMKLLVQSAEVRSYTSGKGTVIKSLELKGMDWPDEAEGLACEGSVVVNLPAPEGAEVGTFKPLKRQTVLVDIVGYRTRAFGKEVTVEFKGRLSGNGAPSALAEAPSVPPTPRAKSEAEVPAN